jgi:putative intracellular protease/amidase
MPAVLIVVSAADHWTLTDGTAHPTGFWAEEFAEPHRLFREAGWQVTVATPGGVAPTVDRLSLRFPAGPPWRLRRYRRYLRDHADELAHPRDLARVRPEEYDAVFYPGGHGPMADLAVDPVSGALLTSALRSGTPLALLCHAPAALLAATTEDGPWPFAGYTVTALSNREELLNRFARKAPWLLEDRLVAAGARYVRRRVPLLPFVTVDRGLYTGQNPASSRRLARRLIADLTASPALAVQVSRTVAAPPEQVYALVSDIRRMGEWSPRPTPRTGSSRAGASGAGTGSVRCTAGAPPRRSPRPLRAGPSPSPRRGRPPRRGATSWSRSTAAPGSPSR